VVVEDLYLGADSNPAFLINMNGTLLFAADSSNTGMELWKVVPDNQSENPSDPGNPSGPDSPPNTNPGSSGGGGGGGAFGLLVLYFVLARVIIRPGRVVSYRC
jgi:hypothetical protein